MSISVQLQILYCRVYLWQKTAPVHISFEKWGYISVHPVLYYNTIEETRRNSILLNICAKDIFNEMSIGMTLDRITEIGMYPEYFNWRDTFSLGWVCIGRLLIFRRSIIFFTDKIEQTRLHLSALTKVYRRGVHRDRQVSLLTGLSCINWNQIWKTSGINMLSKNLVRQLARVIVLRSASPLP